MASNEGLNIAIGANLTGLTTGLDRAVNSLTQTSNTIESIAANLVAAFNSLQPAVNNTVSIVNNLSPVTAAAAAGITNLSAAITSGQASFTSLGAASTQASTGINTITASATNAVNSINNLSPASGASAAGITNLANAIQSGQASFTGLGTATTRTSTGLNNVTTSATNTTASINRLSPVTGAAAAGITNLSRSITAGQISLNGATLNANRLAPALNNLNRPSGSAANSLQNLGRIASDAPFGFIAIQNNLDPLFDSFRRLQAETGSSGAALRALGKSLVGPAGIALAFTVVSSGITFLIQKYGSLSAGLAALNPFTSEATRTQLALNKAMLEGGKAAQEEIVHVGLLYKASQDLTVPLSERKAIVDKLQKQYPETFSGLSKEAILAGQAASAYEKLNDTLIASATIKATEGLIVDQQKKLFELKLEARSTKEAIDKIAKGSGTGIIGDLLGLTDAAAKAKTLSYLQASLNDNSQKQLELNKETKSIQEEQLKLVQQFGAKSLGVSGATTTVQVLGQLKVALSEVDSKAKLTGATAKDIAKDKLPLLNKAFDQIASIGDTGAAAALKQLGSQISTLDTIAEAKSLPKVSDVLTTLKSDLASVGAQSKLTGLSFDDLSKEKITALQKAFEGLIKAGLTPVSPEIKKISSQIELLSASIIGKKDLKGVKLFKFDGKEIVTAESQIVILRTEIKRLIDSGFDPGAEAVTNLQKKLSVLQGTVGDKPLFDVDNFTSANGKLKSLSSGLINVSKAQAQFNAKIKDGLYQSAALRLSLTDLENSIKTGLKGSVIDSAAAISEGLGNILSKGGGIQSLFSGIASVIGGFLQALGKQLIVYGTTLLGFKIALKSLNPAVAIGAGVLAIAAGAAFKNFASKGIPSFATGGLVTEPTLAMVGDNPGQKEAIIPSELWDKIGGGGTGFIAETRVGLTELIIGLRRAEREGRR